MSKLAYFHQNYHFVPSCIFKSEFHVDDLISKCAWYFIVLAYHNFQRKLAYWTQIETWLCLVSITNNKLMEKWNVMNYFTFLWFASVYFSSRVLFSQNMEYSTLKELSLSVENLRICLNEETSLLGCFWTSSLPKEGVESKLLFEVITCSLPKQGFKSKLVWGSLGSLFWGDHKGGV